MDFIEYIGLLSVLVVVARILWELKTIFVPQNQIPQGWAVVTGATEGIGKAFCEELVKKNINVCMVVRNVKKAHDVIQGFGNVKSEFKIIEADFEKSFEDNFYSNIFNQLKDLKISILVNNVGVLYVGPLESIEDKNIRQQIIVNCAPAVFMTKYLLPLMPPNSVVITLSSQAGRFAAPYYQIYGATKAFPDFFSRAMNAERLDIKFISLRPGYVQTRMTKNQMDLITVTPNQCVASTLQRLECAHTGGQWLHRLQQYLMTYVEGDLMDWLLPSFSKKLAMAKH